MSRSISTHSLTVTLVRLLAASERRMYSRGISIRVESIAQDERTLMCTVFQHRRALMSKPMDTLQLVHLAEGALAPLLGAGFTPMISAYDWGHAEDLRNSHDRPDDHDPLGLISALRHAGLQYPRLKSIQEEQDRKPLVQLPLWRRALGIFAMW
jgi:hypothetical protein